MAKPLKIGIEGDELVLRIGIDTLVVAAENCPSLFDNDERRHPPYAKVVDKMELAKDVVRKLNCEDEDGSTLVTTAIDTAILCAWEDGSQGFEEDAA